MIRTAHYLSALVRVARRHTADRRSFVRAVLFAIAVFRRGGARGLVDTLRSAARQSGPATDEYRQWIEAYDTIGYQDVSAMRRHMDKLARKPLISVVMPVYNTPAALLREAIESVLAQVYENWELCIADDCSPAPHVRLILEEYAKRDPRVRVVYRRQNGHISRASNSAVELATGEWIAFLDHDDLLRPHSLLCVADAINQNSEAKLLYSDEDKIDAEGNRYGHYFKCDWNPNLFLSHNLITHLAVYRADLLASIGGLRAGYEGAQDYDLALRFIEQISEREIHHIPHILYHWRAVAGSTALGSDEKPYAMLAGERVLNEHLARTNIKAKAQLIGHGYRIDYDLPVVPPLVSIIIPTRNAKSLVARCVKSIRDRTTYSNYEIILIDNGSDEPEAVAYFKELDERGDVRLVRDGRPFNYSALNNAAVEKAKGTILALVNNDTEVITREWLGRLVALALQPGVGAVGAKLLFPDDTLQHGGVVVGLGGLAAHAHSGLSRHSRGYAGRASLEQNYSAVTAACLVVRKESYEAVGGLDEQHLKVAYNDVDFCLKLRERGLRNVWTPFAEIYHHESATRGYETTPDKQLRFEAEKLVIKRRWGTIINHDPAYSPNLTLDSADFSLAFPPRADKPWVVR